MPDPAPRTRSVDRLRLALAAPASTPSGPGRSAAQEAVQDEPPAQRLVRREVRRGAALQPDRPDRAWAQNVRPARRRSDEAAAPAAGAGRPSRRWNRGSTTTRSTEARLSGTCGSGSTNLPPCATASAATLMCSARCRVRVVPADVLINFHKVESEADFRPTCRAWRRCARFRTLLERARRNAEDGTCRASPTRACYAARAVVSGRRSTGWTRPVGRPAGQAGGLAKAGTIDAAARRR